jgi:NAD(P)-dependent dehydrogenase (short-subunit alcohol dehydrogenase family)
MFRLIALSLGFALAAWPAFADTVLITGSDRGLGLEFARQYAAQGWDVIATARNPDGAKDLKDLAASHKNVSIEKLDVTSDSDIAALAAKLKGKPIDLLLNNAGTAGDPKVQTLGTLDRKAFLDEMDVNAFGALAVSQAFRDNVIASKQKKIVAITTTLGSITLVSHSGTFSPYYYRITKAALNMSMQALSQDLKKQGVIVAVVSPGAVETAITTVFRNAFHTNPKTTPPAEAAARVIPVIASLDMDKAAAGIVSYDNKIVPW